MSIDLSNAKRFDCVIKITGGSYIRITFGVDVPNVIHEELINLLEVNGINGLAIEHSEGYYWLEVTFNWKVYEVAQSIMNIMLKEGLSVGII